MLRLLSFCLMLAPLLNVGPSCRCKKKSPPERWNLFPEFREYTQYPPGSWWVYRNIVNGVEDSIHLISQDTGSALNERENVLIQSFSEELHSSLYGPMQGRGYAGAQDFNSYSMSQKGLGWTIDEKFFWESGMAPKISSGIFLRYSALLDTFNLPDNAWRDVAVMEMTGEPYRPVSYRAHWTKDVGLLQEAFYEPDGDSAVWQLQRWYINK